MNGNMKMMEDTASRYRRDLCWDEENRLMAVKTVGRDDESFMGAYIYNAGGERVWKLTGNVERMMINGDQYIDMVNLSNKTLYASPFLVVADQAYTKHYYAGSERVASKIGAGLASALVHPTNYQVPPVNSSMELLPRQIWEMVGRQATCTGMGSGYTNIFNGFGSIESATNQPASDPENEIYFYHTDHLGSSSWITDATGSAYQHMQSLPFGEDFIDQRTSSWTAPYRFTGKERDAETGWDYFGARYYDSELSIWLSVDPLSDMYPGTSPFMYVRGNPVMLVDPNGMYDDPAAAQKAQDKATKKYGSDRVGDVHNSGTDENPNYTFNIYKYGQDKYTHGADGGVMAYTPETSVGSNDDLKSYNSKINGTNYRVAKTMFNDWDQGTGPENRLFFDDDVSNSFRDAWRVNEARDYFYNEFRGQDISNGASVTNYDGSFGIEGYLKAGGDIIEQFVGSYRIDIVAFPESHKLAYIITNTTSFKSLAYGVLPDWKRSEFKLNGNTSQTYIFFEKIDYNRLK